jgi:hypothetical protein
MAKFDFKEMYASLVQRGQFQTPVSVEDANDREKVLRAKLSEIQENLRTKTPSTFASHEDFQKWYRRARVAQAMTSAEIYFVERYRKLERLKKQHGPRVLDFLG